MKLTLHGPDEQNHIRSASTNGFQIGDELHTRSIVISSSELITHWPPQSPAELNLGHLEPILELAPEVVLVGTGESQVFLSPEFLFRFYQEGIGIECMSTQAACRTFNVLVSENRRVVAALMPLLATA
jgi:uncharacterized protein